MKMVFTSNKRKGKITGFFFVDDEDFPRVSAERWYLNGAGYAFATSDSRTSAHRFVMNAGNDVRFIDHIDGDVRNNCKENLRFADSSQNTANRHHVRSASGFKGVTFHKSSGKWQAHIKIKNQYRYLGLFQLIEEAARRYDSAAKEAFGEFAYLNFPEAA